MARVRLDELLVTRGLAASRERARALVLAGDVTVDDRRIDKAGALVDAEARVILRQPDHPWVGRGGLKLAHALDAFGVDVTGRTVLDIGASTGGFTDVLLQRGARRVVALDVGHNQIDWRLRTDPRVVLLEGVNARYLKPDGLPEDARVYSRPLEALGRQGRLDGAGALLASFEPELERVRGAAAEALASTTLA